MMGALWRILKIKLLIIALVMTDDTIFWVGGIKVAFLIKLLHMEECVGFSAHVILIIDSYHPL